MTSTSSTSSSTPIRLSGYSSGIDTESLISQLVSASSGALNQLKTKKTTITQQQTAYKSVQSRVEALLEKLKKITVDTSSVLSTGTDVFKTKTATSSDETIATASASGTAASQTIKLEVIQLATQTKAASTSAVGSLIAADGSTPITQAALGAITTGNFTVYVNGEAKTVTVNSTDKISDVLNSISTATSGAVTGSVSADGKVVLSFADPNVVQLGASTDTSNFLKAMKLTSGVLDDAGATNTITSSSAILAFNPNAALDGGSSGTNTAVTAGSTFTINGKTFNTTNKSLNTLISEINSSSAKVTASFNASTNKFELTSTEAGSSYIALADTSGNFLQAMGLITGTNTTASQTIGKNAQVKINDGNTLYSPTNTVDASVSGITGVSLNLVAQKPGTSITIKVAQDTSAIETALNDFVTSFNDTLSYIDSQTKSSQDASSRGILYSESSMKTFRQRLRQIVTDAVNASGTYNSLQSIGISTGAPKGSSASTATSTLVFDKTVFQKAMADDPDAVRKVVNGQSATDGADGALTKLQTTIKSALGTQASNGADGLFAAFNNSSAARIKSINDAITRAQDRLTQYEANLRKQFTSMETLITQYQSQSSALTSLQNQLSASSS